MAVCKESSGHISHWTHSSFLDHSHANSPSNFTIWSRVNNTNDWVAEFSRKEELNFYLYVTFQKKIKARHLRVSTTNNQSLEISSFEVYEFNHINGEIPFELMHGNQQQSAAIIAHLRGQGWCGPLYGF